MRSNKLNNESNQNTNATNTNNVNRNNKKNKILANNDFCSFCDEGGDLLSCDRCPVSFHFLCHDPPLDIDKIPKGDFLCTKCKTISKITDENFSDSNNIVPSSNDTKTIKFEMQENESALETLIRITKSLNPRQMQLSDDLSLECAFDLPGLNKVKWWTKDGNKIVNLTKASSNLNVISNSSNNNSETKYPNGTLLNSQITNNKNMDISSSETNKSLKSSQNSNETSNYVGLNDYMENHIELCFSCNKGSKDRSQLLKCDFCPLRFHLDCLNLPLCSTPSRDRLWMCPNHLENFIEKNIIKTSRLSERINLWKEYSSSKVNLNSIQIDFINKFKNNTSQNLVKNVERCDIPESIKKMYNKKELEIDEDQQSDETEKELYLSAVEALTLLSNPKQENSSSSSSPETIDAIENKTLIKLPPIHRLNLNAIKPRALLLPITSECLMTDCKKVQIINDVMNSILNDTKINCIDYKQPFHMQYRFMTIGSASNMNVCLNEIDKCEFVSEKHACIYFDEQSNHYELLNYSEYGTVVDNCKYGFNSNIDNSDSDSDSDYDDIRTKSMSATNLKYFFQDKCMCNNNYRNKENLTYWEGPAILNHGSHLKFGCLNFLFIIADSIYNSYLTNNNNNAYENQTIFKINKNTIDSLKYSIKSNSKNLKRLKPKLKKNSLRNYSDVHIEGFIKLINNKGKKKLLVN